MRVLTVVPSYWPAFKYGGPIYSVHYLCRSLAGAGADVDVYTTNKGLEDRYRDGESHVVDGVNVTYFGYSRYFEFLGDSGWQLSRGLCSALSRSINSYDIVYIVSVWNFPVAAACYYCRKNGIPHVISPRGQLYPQTFERGYMKKAPYYKLVSERDLKGATAVHYTTQDEEEGCHGSLGLRNRAFVVPNGIDPAAFGHMPGGGVLRRKYRYLKDKKIILYLGRINWKKGLDVLITAFSGLRRERGDLHLVIAGNDEEGYGVKLRELIGGAGLEYADAAPGGGVANKTEYSEGCTADVTFTGMVEGADKLELLAGADIFTLPSYSENFGMSVVEAMASGTPAIISDMVGIHNEVGQSGSCIVIKNSPVNLMAAIKRVLDDRALAESLIENAKRHVREFYDVKKTAELMKKNFEAVIAYGK